MLRAMSRPRNREVRVRWSRRGAAAFAALCALLAGAGDGGVAGPDQFGIYVATLGGGTPRLVVASPWQQMTHPRVSPDQEWITFTRYHKKNFRGLALERNGYQQTEIAIVRSDGSELRSVIAPRAGAINANSHWSSDGKSLLWFSTENDLHAPRIMRIDLATGAIARLPTPPQLKTTDPHHVGNLLVFPVVGEDVDALWIMNLDGTNCRQLTNPTFPEGMERGGFPPGDYDPKLSPDGARVAFMRLFGKVGWRIFVVDVASGKERDLSGAANIDTLPDWSGDGKLLLFWHIDLEDPARMGLYTMRPDGSQRTMVDVPRGYLHGHPQFFPADGSSPQARIIYTARKMRLP